MKGSKLTGMLMTVAWVTTPSLGGVAVFTPPDATVTAGTPILVDVEVTLESPTAFNFAEILIGSDAATDLALTLDADWTTAFASTEGPFYDENGLYAQEIYVQSDTSGGPPLVLSSLALGTVTIDTTGMANGDYTVAIDENLDELNRLALLGGEEPFYYPVSGTFNFTIVPEPGGLALLALGGLAALKRRRHGAPLS